MRFVFLTLGYTPDLDGGGYRYATEVAELLASRGHEVHALYPSPDESLPPRDVRRGVQLHRLPRGQGSFFRRWRAANRAARQRVGELLRDATSSTLLFSHHAYLEPAPRGLPYAMILQGPWALEHRFARQGLSRSWKTRLLDALACRFMARLERRSLRGAQQVFVASDYSRLQIRIWHPGVTCNAEVIGGGADLRRFQPPANRALVRTGCGLAPEDFLFLTVRRLDPRMGLTLVIDAFAKVTKEFPHAKLWLAGRGQQQAELAERIRQAGLGDRVRLLGFVPEEQLPKLYAAADCVLMPSLDLEGFGLVTAEALACGTPVAASRAGANAELITPLAPELLFPAGDAPALAASLRRILQQPERLPARDQCAAYARTQFRWDRPADACERAYVRFAVPAWKERA